MSVDARSDVQTDEDFDEDLVRPSLWLLFFGGEGGCKAQMSIVLHRDEGADLIHKGGQTKKENGVWSKCKDCIWRCNIKL